MPSTPPSTPAAAQQPQERPKAGTLQDLVERRDCAERRLEAAERHVQQWRHLSQQLHSIAESGTYGPETVEAAQLLLGEVDPQFVQIAVERVAAGIILGSIERALKEAQEA